MTDIRSALDTIVKILKQQINFDLCMVTRVVDDDWIMLATTDNNYDITTEEIKVWSDSICCRMVQQEDLNIIPNVDDIPLYRAAPITQQAEINAYIGYPLKSESGELLGTLCAIDRKQKTVLLHEQKAMLESYVSVLEVLFRQSHIINQLLLPSLSQAALEQADTPRLLKSKSTFYEIAAAQQSQLQSIASPLAIMTIHVLQSEPEIGSARSEAENLVLVNELQLFLRQDVDVLCSLEQDCFGILMPDCDNKLLTSKVIEMLKVMHKKGYRVEVGAHVCAHQEPIDSAIEKARKRTFK